MKIVLQKEVEKLGVPGDVVSVADGYARNYLIPKGFAAPATKGSAKNAERLRRTHDQKVQKAVLEARTGATVDRRTVHLAEPIRTVGTHEVTIRLHPEVEAAVTVEVVAE